VAVLVYKKQKHVINVFIWPTDKTGEAMRATSKDGYNLVSWSQQGMNFRAVSDVNQADLEELAKLVGAEGK
jgi:anti-sigma factor RsiW